MQNYTKYPNQSLETSMSYNTEKIICLIFTLNHYKHLKDTFYMQFDVKFEHRVTRGNPFLPQTV